MMLDFFKRKYQESISSGFEPVSDMIYLARGGALIGAAPFPGTEDYVDRTREDVHTVSLKKVSGTTTRFAIKKEKLQQPQPGTRTSTRIKRPNTRTTKFKIDRGGRKTRKIRLK